MRQDPASGEYPKVGPKGMELLALAVAKRKPVNMEDYLKPQPKVVRREGSEIDFQSGSKFTDQGQFERGHSRILPFS